MIDQDKKLARPVREPPPERVPFSVLDAHVTHGIDLLWRLLIGLIAGLLGALFLWLALKVAPEAGSLDRIGSPWFVLVVPIIGGGLVAFAVGQVLQLVWVGGDQGYDERLWARMTSRERGRWRLREAASGRWTFRLFLVLALCALLYMEAHLWPLLSQEVAAGFALTTLAIAGLALWSFLGQTLPADAPPDATWISQGRWVSEPRSVSYAEGWIGVGAGAAALAMSHLMYAMNPKNYDAARMAGGGWLGLAFGAFFLAAAWWERRKPGTRLEIVRETDRPLVLACTITLRLPPEEVASADWLARLVASTASNPTVMADKNWMRWLDVTAPAVVVRGTSSVRFTLHVDVPKDMPYWPPTWMLRLEDRKGLHDALTFILPWQIVFSEEYPAQ